MITEIKIRSRGDSSPNTNKCSIIRGITVGLVGTKAMNEICLGAGASGL